jgi:hypothetical protein
MENISIGQFTNMEVKMLDKIYELCDSLPDTIKAVIIISFIAIFWDIVL